MVNAAVAAARGRHEAGTQIVAEHELRLVRYDAERVRRAR